MKNLIKILLILVLLITSCQKEEQNDSLYSITYEGKTYYTTYYSTHYNTNKKPCITFTDSNNNSATIICGDFIVTKLK